MSRTTVQVCHLVALCLLAAAFALADSIATPVASADQGKKLNPPPTSLWKSYPLERRPSTTEPAGAKVRKRQLSRRSSPQQHEFLSPVVVSAIILLLGSAAIVLMRSSLPIRVGNSLRAHDRVAMPRATQRASGRPRLRLRRPQQLREVIPDVVGEPHARATKPPAPEPDGDLLEALQPKPLWAPEPEPAPDVAVDLEEVRAARTPEPVEQRPATQRDLQQTSDPLVEEREDGAGPSREGELALELQGLIADVQVVPEPEPTPQTDEEPRAVPQQTRLERASVESCEIRLWRGRVKCQLVAVLTGAEEVIAVSPHFGLRDEDSPSDEARLALGALVARLERGGWTVVSQGPTWYEQWLLEPFANPDEYSNA